MTASETRDIFQPGDLLNNTYRIEAILGRGGTSEVYKARSEISGKVMAIKALRAEFASNDDFLVLMTREEDVREIRHDAVVRYFDTQKTPEGVVYLVMEHVDGVALDQKLAQGGMSAEDLMVVGRRVCEGLVAAHTRNIVHRDLSPDNIILRDDRPDQAVIIDFGIAKDTNPGAETIVGNEFAGKYAYAAPEQLAGQTDARSDIYALGALLLSTFRGKTPDVGANPMEVVQNKQLPPDTEGVPDPLRGLIAQMTQPDPLARFQSAAELLAAFENPGARDQADLDDVLDDATVIKPLGGKAQTSIDALLAPKEDPEPVAAASAPKKSGVLWPVLGVLAVLGGGAGAWFSGALDAVFAPGLPVADPYTLVVEKRADGTGRVEGNVPSGAVSEQLLREMAALAPEVAVTPARGDIAEDWGAGLVEIVGEAMPLEEFLIEARGNSVRISGLAADQPGLETVQAALTEGLPEGLQVALDLAVGPRFVSADALRPLLAAHADCGRLHLPDVPPLGYGLDDTIIVTGRFADATAREGLAADLTSLAGPRPVRIEAEVLNESLCEIDAVLPRAESGGFDVLFGFGETGAANPSGRYQVGENPTIDVRLPKDVTDGYLWVSVVDVQGVVFHLLPNLTRQDNSIAALRAEAGDGPVRVAYGLEEARASGLLAFTVDGSVLGKSKVVVLHSAAPLFDALRPTSESAASYADALRAARDEGGLAVTALDTAILTTEE